MEDKLVIEALKRKLVSIGSDIRTTMAHVRKLEGQKVTLLATLRLFEGKTEEDRPTVTSIGFPAGAFSRMLLEVLREAETALSPREIAEALIKTTGNRTLEKREMEILLVRVRNALHRMNAQVESETRDRTTYWRITE